MHPGGIIAPDLLLEQLVLLNLELARPLSPPSVSFVVCLLLQYCSIRILYYA